jgi:NAD(P)-dependent dehydrogenase (short-subunit alcohol dehydrogenase family)
MPTINWQSLKHLCHIRFTYTKSIVDKGLDVLFYQLDVSNQSNISKIAYQIEQQFGRLDILVNNAAILYDTWQNAINANLDVVNQALTTNLFGPWRLSQVCIPIMKTNKYGRIVNVSSEAGSLHYMGAGTPAYNVSKAALNAFTRILAAELSSGTGILVNSVDPGWVATDMGGRGGRPVQEGAKVIVWAATLPDKGPTGGFSLTASLLHGKVVEINRHCDTVPDRLTFGPARIDSAKGRNH